MLRKTVAAIAAFLSVLALLSCAGTSSTVAGGQQALIDRAIDAMGGAQALSGINTVVAKGSWKQWEPEQSEEPSGAMRFGNEATFEVIQDRAARASRTDYVKKFAYPAPRTFTFSEIVTPDAGAVIGVDSNGMPGQTVKSDPPVHAMSGYRLAAAQREALRGSVSALMLAMRANPERVRAVAAMATPRGETLPTVAYDAPAGTTYFVAFDPANGGLPSRVRTL